MPTPLITAQILNDVRTRRINLFGRENKDSLVLQLQKSLTAIDAQSIAVLRYLMFHSKRVADAGNIS